MTAKVISSDPVDRATVLLASFEWTREVLLDSATRAFIGGKLLEIESKFLENFVKSDENSWLFTYTVPNPCSNEILAAKDAVQRALGSQLDLRGTKGQANQP